MSADPQFTAGAGARYSCWRLSELREWFDLGFIGVSEAQDIENYCSFIGAYDVLSWFRDVRPLVHGPVGCVASFSATRVQTRAASQPRPLPYCTALTTQDAIQGGARKLREAILDLDAREHPRLIVVLATCVSDIIGDDIADVLAGVRPAVGADLRYLAVAGTSVKGFREGGDQAIQDLVQYVGERHAGIERDPTPSVNLFTRRVSGKPSEDGDIAETTRLLATIGVGVNRVIRLGSSLDDLIQAPRAWANAAFCFTWGDAPMQALERCFGQPYSTVSYPVGLRQTLAWVEAIARLTEMPNRLPDDPEVRAAEARIARLRARLDGRPAYVWHPGEKGLALARFAEEIGCRPHLIAMTYWMQKMNEHSIGSMIDAGQDYPVIIKGWLDLWESHRDVPPAERPLLFMPKKFWLGELPTVTLNVFYDSLLGLRGLGALLDAVEAALDGAGVRNYRLFDRYVERRYRKVEWTPTPPAGSP